MPHATPEAWKAIPGHEGAYEVSNHGRVRSIDRRVRRGNRWMHVKGRVIKTPAKSNGYLHFKLADRDRTYYPTVHAVVAAAFLGKRPEGWVVNHKDGDRTNNHLSNLEYTTYSGNNNHAVAQGRMHKGESHPNSKLTEHQVRTIRRLRGIAKARELAKDHGIDVAHVYAIWRRARWRHLD